MTPTTRYLIGGTPETAAIYSTDSGNDGVGTLSCIGSCDAGGQEDADPAGRSNSLTISMDGIDDQGGNGIDPKGPQGLQNPRAVATWAEVGGAHDTFCERTPTRSSCSTLPFGHPLSCGEGNSRLVLNPFAARGRDNVWPRSSSASR